MSRCSFGRHFQQQRPQQLVTSKLKAASSRAHKPLDLFLPSGLLLRSTNRTLGPCSRHHLRGISCPEQIRVRNDSCRATIAFNRAPHTSIQPPVIDNRRNIVQRTVRFERSETRVVVARTAVWVRIGNCIWQNALHPPLVHRRSIPWLNWKQRS